jgi:ribokinase
MSRIVCVGSMNMDIAAYSDALPRPGETVFGSSLVSSPGGKGLNQAVAARRLGAQVTFAGCLGKDQTGDQLVAFLASEGIDTSGISRSDTAQTGAAIILVDRSSENAIVVISGANMSWPVGALDKLRLTADDIVVSQFEVPDEIIVEAFSRARAVGALTMLNAAPARAIPPQLLTLIDVLVVNENELAACAATPLDTTDASAVADVALAFASDQRSVVATLGAKGAVVASAGSAIYMPGLAVDAIDTAGAGDCFVGALAAALLRGEELRSAAAFANRAASISVTRRGTAIAMPRASEL